MIVTHYRKEGSDFYLFVNSDRENELEVRVANSLTNILEENPKTSGLLGRARIVRV